MVTLAGTSVGGRREDEMKPPTSTRPLEWKTLTLEGFDFLCSDTSYSLMNSIITVGCTMGWKNSALYSSSHSVSANEQISLDVGGDIGKRNSRAVVSSADKARNNSAFKGTVRDSISQQVS